MPDSPTITPRAHYSAARLRASLWTELRLRAASLRRDDADVAQVAALLADLDVVEQYWATPGRARIAQLQLMLERGEYAALHRIVDRLVRSVVVGSGASDGDPMDEGDGNLETDARAGGRSGGRREHFELLVVGEADSDAEAELRASLRRARSADDEFTYDVLVVRTVQDALMALVFNASIQACVIQYGVPFRSPHADGLLRPFTRQFAGVVLDALDKPALGPRLGEMVREYRPEVDRYYVTDTPISALRDRTIETFRRIFYSTEDLQELHLAVLRGVRERYQTPFFSALKAYSRKPMGVFHAMPISRGNSVFKSRWIHDFGEFYGRNLFLAETSATTGGLDSLLQPTGPLKEAQEMAAKAFGSQRTFFATNGTSSSNKIVMQALVQPGDVVLIDRDCHKSHHYGMVQSGAFPVYLHSYPLPTFSMYGAVPLEHIRERLLTLKAAGRLERVKMLLLTNSTFDGLVYNVEQVMEAVLAIKPDIVFLWDEAWFAFAGFCHFMRQRTAMRAAATLHAKYRTPAYREAFERHIASLGPDEAPRMPDPDAVRVRVYATQSTHKTLSALRQGSMIHIWDEDFLRRSEAAFGEAYMTHTSTSPNYQILASLDVGRRQVELEGYELVDKAVDLGMTLRRTVLEHPVLQKWFDIVTIGGLIPTDYRPSGLTEYYTSGQGWQEISRAWAQDEFTLDPTKVNLFTGKTGIDGDTFKNRYLMDRHSIQINKTTRNTVLFMSNIGTTRSSVAYLTKVLLQIAEDLERRYAGMDDIERRLHHEAVESLTATAQPLPDFTSFHSSFQAVPGVPGGDLRTATFLGYDEQHCRHVPLGEAVERLEAGEALVSAAFVIPYPPGFPVLVPGQVVDRAILEFMLQLDVKEIHGYRPQIGLRLFTDAALGRQQTASAMGAIGYAKAAAPPRPTDHAATPSRAPARRIPTTSATRTRT